MLDSAQLDQAVLCPDPYEPNESCADAKSLGASQGSTWVSVSATSSPAGDVDWFTASSQYPPTTCMPGTSRCYRFQVRLEVPAGQRLKVCLLRDDCNAVPSCADNATDPGPQQLEIHYEVEALCGFSLDTQAMISVEQIDAQAGCEQYSLSFIYDAC